VNHDVLDGLFREVFGVGFEILALEPATGGLDNVLALLGGLLHFAGKKQTTGSRDIARKLIE